jgi:hypothetical protein
MKLLKAVFTNALVLATLVTSLAGTILVAYAVDKPGAARQAPPVASKAADGVAHLRDMPAAHRGVNGESGEKPPPVVFWGTAVPRGSFIDAML